MTIDDLHRRRARHRPAAVAGRLARRVRPDDDGPQDAASATRDIWTVPADGRSGRTGARSPATRARTPRGSSPDGRRLAFISTARRRAAGVRRRCGRRQRATRSRTSRWACSRRWLFRRTARASPSCRTCIRSAPTRRATSERSEEAEKNPVKVRRLTRLLYRHWDEWRENVRHHVFVADVRRRARARRHAGRLRLAAGQQEDGAIAFSPDGTRDRVRVEPRRRRRGGVDDEPRRLGRAGRRRRAAKKITTNPASDLQPVFSRDGTTLFVRAQRRAGFEADRWYLDAYDRATGAKRTVFQTPDISVGDFTLSQDGATIWFTAATAGARESLHRAGRGRHAEARAPRGRDLVACSPGAGLRRVREVHADGADRHLPRRPRTARP